MEESILTHISDKRLISVNNSYAQQQKTNNPGKRMGKALEKVFPPKKYTNDQ